jgi:hypothetical protein
MTLLNNEKNKNATGLTGRYGEENGERAPSGIERGTRYRGALNCRRSFLTLEQVFGGDTRNE